MAALVNKTSPGMRLQRGAAVLAAARVVDTRLVTDRLQRFEQAHRNYVDAQQAVDTLDAELGAAQARLVKLDKTKNRAVDMLARALINVGQPKSNPFAPFDTGPPSALARLPLAEETDAIGHLAAAVLHGHGATKQTMKAAQAADKAARAVRQALAPIEKLETSIRDARHNRDAIGQAWESALAALRRGARSAGDEGAPDLYATLFPPMTRTTGKTKPSTEPPTAPETPTATPNAA